jgi:hypothetical protein
MNQPSIVAGAIRRIMGEKRAELLSYQLTCPGAGWTEDSCVFSPSTSGRQTVDLTLGELVALLENSGDHEVTRARLAEAVALLKRASIHLNTDRPIIRRDIDAFLAAQERVLCRACGNPISTHFSCSIELQRLLAAAEEAHRRTAEVLAAVREHQAAMSARLAAAEAAIKEERQHSCIAEAGAHQLALACDKAMNERDDLQERLAAAEARAVRAEGAVTTALSRLNDWNECDGKVNGYQCGGQTICLACEDRIIDALDALRAAVGEEGE